ncbi:MAG: ribonuclease P protein component [Rhodobacteraceae bacterium]|nr:ribonuclease P protein component [Paracoccaceae bacterium]
MTAPERPVAGPRAGAAAEAPAASAPLAVLRRRADFLKAAQARRQGTAGFLLQARRRTPDEDGGTIRVGFTASRKVGNAVARNRARRRLRAVARAVLPGAGRPGWDYVLVARPEGTAARPYRDLVADLRWALERVHRG